MKLKRNFYQRPTVEVAKDLLGKFLVHKYRPSTMLRAGGIYEAMITETEAYAGFDDLACHGSRGLTERNKIMFGPGGFAYVYLIYGIYHCLNLTTEKEGIPSAVLIRGLDYPNADGSVSARPSLDGPGKLCRAFKITKQTHNGLDLSGDKLWVEDRGVKPSKIISGPRIGIAYAKHCASWPWRFWIKK